MHPRGRFAAHPCARKLRDRKPFLAAASKIECSGMTTGGISMAATTKLTFAEYLQLPEEPGKRFELDRGERIPEPSPSLRHNVIRERIARHLTDFVSANRLGAVTVENDFRLAPVIRTWPLLQRNH